MTYMLTITEEHVRNPRSLGQKYFPLAQCLGRLLLCDVGKRAYERNGVWQVENNEQRDRRLNNGAH